MEKEIAAYIAFIQADFAAYYDRADVNPEFAASQIKQYNESFRVDGGASYAKIVCNGSVHSFIVKVASDKFKIGDILKPAGWKAPAKNFARGNVFTAEYGNCSWTGAH